MNKLLRITAAALVAQQLGVAPVSAAAPSVEQLGVVSSLASANDVSGLKAYVDANPSLISPQSPIRTLLIQLRNPRLEQRVITALNTSLEGITVGQAASRISSRQASIY